MSEFLPEAVARYEGGDTEEQLVIGSERDFIELQEPEAVCVLGKYALQRAQQYLTVAYECQEALSDWGYADKRRGKRIDLSGKADMFERDSDQ